MLPALPPRVALVAVAALAAVSGCAPAEEGGTASSPGPDVATSHAAGEPEPALVLAAGDVDPEQVHGYTALAAQAVEKVERLWGAGAVPRPVLVQVAGDAVTFGELSGHADDAGEIPATTVGGLGEARIVVHPATWRRLTEEGRLAVLTHEVTHLVQLAVPEGAAPQQVPGWLHEGLAEYTAHRGSDRPREQIAGSVLDLVREEGPPPGWPEPAGPGDRWHGYALSWLACAYLADTHGEEPLLRLWGQVATGTAPQEALASVTGEDPAQVRRDWQAWLAELAEQTRRATAGPGG